MIQLRPILDRNWYNLRRNFFQSYNELIGERVWLHRVSSPRNKHVLLKHFVSLIYYFVPTKYYFVIVLIPQNYIFWTRIWMIFGWWSTLLKLLPKIKKVLSLTFKVVSFHAVFIVCFRCGHSILHQGHTAVTEGNIPRFQNSDF